MKELNRVTVQKPELPVKVLQFGEGNFLRAFVDWMIDIANEKGVMQHGIVIVQPIEKGMTDALRKQDNLYHVYLEGIKDKKPVKDIRLVKSVQDAVNPYVDYVKYESYFLSPDLEITVSNTTEAGIRYEAGEDIFAKPPQSYPGKMTALLYHRFKHFNGTPQSGLTIVCCELIENNGSTLREYVLRHAEANCLGEDFVRWVTDHCRFCDTLVDRIVTGFPRENTDGIKAELGYNDNLMVKAEYYHLWAIGGAGYKEVSNVLPLDKAGLHVLYMPSIQSFRDKKVRVLNGSHTAMVPVGLQLGCETVMDAFNHPLVEKFINTMVADEVLPMIHEDRGELEVFSAGILERFYNPYIRHLLSAISLNSLSKWETRNFPTVLDNFEKAEKTAKYNLFALAALLVLYSGKSEVPFTPEDNPKHLEFIRQHWDGTDVERSVREIIENKNIWTIPLTAVTPLVSTVSGFVREIVNDGMEKALANLVK
ncbi:tagaturonate reductase [termite gut metagenome]|uniref:Tagaturonate reductase n=1 Tax=termite gut metagenome TaxID=433724 RepID=A0A5J4T1M1_9ZZZZ